MADPFTIEATTPAGGTWTGTLRVEAAEADADLSSAAETIGIFAACTAAAMFPADESPGGIEFTATPTSSSSAGVLEYALEAKGVGASTIRALLMMMRVSHESHAPLSSVSLTCAPASGNVATEEQILLLPLPPARAPEDLALSGLAPDLVDNAFVIRVRFASALEKSQAEALLELFADWDSILLLGGFAESLDLDEMAIWPGDTAQRSPRTVEHDATAYSGGPVPLAALFRGLAHVSAANGLSIEEIEIE